MRRKNVTAGLASALAVAVFTATFFTFGALATSKPKTISHIAAANLGIYSDSACTQSLTSTDWGTVTPGMMVSRTLYIKNLGTVPLKLRLSKTNTNPSTVDQSIVLTWDLEGAVLPVGQAQGATLTLSMSLSASGFTAFSVDAVIGGQAIKGKSDQ